MKPHQRLFLHPMHHPKDTSIKMMQELHHKTCGPIFRDLLGIKQMTVGYRHPANIRDLLIPSKLKTYKEDKFTFSTHIKNTSLEHCIEDMNLDELRKRKSMKNKTIFHQKYNESITTQQKLQKELSCLTLTPKKHSRNNHNATRRNG